MIGKVLKSLLSDAYDAWYNDQLAGETYKELAELVTAKADELLEQKAISDDEWYGSTANCRHIVSGRCGDPA